MDIPSDVDDLLGSTEYLIAITVAMITLACVLAWVLIDGKRKRKALTGDDLKASAEGMLRKIRSQLELIEEDLRKMPGATLDNEEDEEKQEDKRKTDLLDEPIDTVDGMQAILDRTDRETISSLSSEDLPDDSPIRFETEETTVVAEETIETEMLDPVFDLLKNKELSHDLLSMDSLVTEEVQDILKRDEADDEEGWAPPIHSTLEEFETERSLIDVSKEEILELLADNQTPDELEFELLEKQLLSIEEDLNVLLAEIGSCVEEDKLIQLETNVRSIDNELTSVSRSIFVEHLNSLSPYVEKLQGQCVDAMEWGSFQREKWAKEYSEGDDELAEIGELDDKF